MAALTYAHTHTHAHTPNSGCVSYSSFRKYWQQRPNLLSWLMWRRFRWGGGWRSARLTRDRKENWVNTLLFHSLIANESYSWAWIEAAERHPTPSQTVPSRLSHCFRFFLYLFIYFFSSLLKNRTRRLHAAPHEYFTWEGNMKRTRASAVVLHVRGNKQVKQPDVVSSLLKGPVQHFQTVFKVFPFMTANKHTKRLLSTLIFEGRGQFWGL